ncbi:hypothetical protein AMAG_07396 [Allomyces macrogynus ATCC 38327]|uniref:STI1 domain-containing protein n=1 Tax=Allomyces macrogynus (strain ATCC 38327) TaxID=578462 RepID=A0A0L0SI14_ALLM3|nr:hypothetical protein AMAG_07396 [Allomyces macrogynus ATCC 38327]|eukprot:KNE62151.1 hypothetical protein AMAG_07396 [Allomyces macrogynus ATCC 38327]
MSTADQLKAAGNKAFSAGQFQDAIKHFSAAIEVDPKNHVLYSNRSAAYASLKQFPDALRDAEKTVELAPQWAKGYSRLGAARHGLGDLDAAKEAYEQGLKVEPNNALLARGIKDVETAMAAERPGGKNDPIAGLLNNDIWGKIAANPKLAPYLADPSYVAQVKAMIANPSSGMAAMQDQRIMMTLLTLMGINMTTAEEAGLNTDNIPKPRSRSPSPVRAEPAPKPRAASPVKETPREAPAPASTSRSVPAEDKMEVDEQPEVDEEAQRREAMLAEKEKGNAAYKKRDFETALVHYGKAWELSDEREITVLTNMAAVYFEQAEYQKCIEKCHAAIDLGREQRADFKLIARALARIGNAYVKLDQLDDAIKFYQKSLTEHRTADTLQRLRDTEKLLEQRKKAAYHDPALADAARDRGNELFKKHDYAAAVKEYTEAIARNEADPRAYSNRAACYHKLGAIPEAKKDCDAAIARDPSFVKAYIRKAALLHLTKEYKAALEVCEQAANADKDGKHSHEIQQQIQKSTAAMYSGDPKAREERAKRAMQDPEVQQILQDPIMNQILSQMQSDPGAIREHLKNPMIAAKIQKLVEAGVLAVN